MKNAKLLYEILTTRTDSVNLSNLCYQKHIPYTNDSHGPCERLYKLKELNPNIEIEEEVDLPGLCYIKSKPRTPPELKRCESVDTDPGMGYENCCPMEEYDMLMLLQKPEIQYIREHKIELGLFVILSIVLIVYIIYLLFRKK